MNAKATALIKVAEVKAPWTDRNTELFKFVATEPNCAGLRGRTSFAKPYLIIESSHYANIDKAPHYYANFISQLAFRGYTNFEFAE